MPSSASWVGTPSIRGSSESMRMILLTICQVGLSFTWGVEMTYFTPYLLQMGLSKSRTSLVWIAGPLSGLIVQPVIGVLADTSRSKYGRRRPFMLGGAILVAICLMILGWTAEIVGHFIPDPEAAKPYVVTLAVITIYATDFSINSTQCSSRSLIVDTLPTSKQQVASAWASRMIAVGNMITYAVGAIDLVGLFGTTLGETQFKQLTTIAAFMFLFTTALTCWAVEERVLVSGTDEDLKSSVVSLLANIVKTMMHLPERISAICWVNFWAWIGWFPFLFYSTTWCGEVYFRYHPEAQSSADALGDVGRIGSHSLVIFSVITLLGTVGLPWIVRSPDDSNEQPAFTRRPPPALRSIIEPLVDLIQDRRPTLLTAWQLGHLVFAGAMCLAPFVTSLRMATTIVSLCGIPWALTCWAPFTFVGVEVNRLTAPATHLNGHSYHRRQSTAESGKGGDYPSPSASPKLLHLNHLDRDIIDDEKEPLSLDEKDSNASTGETSGIYFGILNVFCTIPQFIGTFIAWVVFSLLEPGKSPELHKEATHEDIKAAADRPNGIAVCLFIGAISTVGAAYATGRMRKKGMR